MITIKNIAEKANVTEATVSRILSGKGQKHSAKTIEKVFKISNKLGYVVDDMARSIATGKAKAIAFLTTAPDLAHTDAIFKAMSLYFNSKGYFFMSFPGACFTFCEPENGEF